MKVKKILTSKFYIFLCLVILSGLVFFILNDYYKSRGIRAEFTELQDEIQELEKQKQKLLDTQKHLETQTYFERQARKKLGLKKQGEEVMFIRELEQVMQKDKIPDLNILQSSQLKTSRFNKLIQWFKFLIE